MSNRLAIAGTLLLVVSACTPKDKSATASTDSVAAAASAAPNVVTVHAADYSYKAPAQIPAGMTTFNLVNDGKVPHHLLLIRLDSGKTIADLTAALKLPAAPPSWAVSEGGPNAPDPTKESNATFDLVPGNYVMICMVGVPGAVPHFARGMMTPLEVTAAPAGPPAAAPAADMAITLRDYSFTTSGPLTSGTHTFAVSNAGTQPHEVELVKLAPGKTLKEAMAWFEKPAGPPPASAIGGIAPFVGGTKYFTADITPGNYAFICFVRDANDGKPHYMHGMMTTITAS